MPKHKILFLTQRSPRHQQDALAGAPPDCDVVMLRQPTRAVMLEQLVDAEFLISERADEIDAAMIEAGTHLRLIQRLGSLTFDIDLEAARQHGIPVCIAPVVGSIMVAEHMVMQMLALVKRLPEVTDIALAAGDWGQPSRRTDENVFAYNWSRRTAITGIYGRTVGILGFGEIGAELARRLATFRPAQILYNKRRRLPDLVEDELRLTYATAEAIYDNSDFLCTLLPFYPETELILNASVFGRMKRGAFVVNCGSGSVIDEAALASAVETGHLGGAALDTYEWEPIRPDNPLLRLARTPGMNVLLTPHTAAGAASATADTGGRAQDFANIRRVLAGETPLNRVV